MFINTFVGRGVASWHVMLDLNKKCHSVSRLVVCHSFIKCIAHETSHCQYWPHLPIMSFSISQSGPLCQNPTYRKDCQNGGFCKEDATGNYTFCQCPAEYEGELCERPANYCAPMPCKNGGICHTNDANDGYTCECVPG